jgi:uncharacterized protein
MHEFPGSSRRFAYLVNAGAIFELDGPAGVVIDRLRDGVATHEELVTTLTDWGCSIPEAEELVQELYLSRVLMTGESVHEPLNEVPENFPLQSMVMNLTNQCNLSCTYCYEFGEDKVATPEGKKKFMDLETAQQSVDFLMAQSGERQAVHITFFGGETLMNFPLLKQVVGYAEQKAKEQGRSIDFSLTTNATLLTPQIIEFLSEHRIGVTVSMDGPKEMHDKLRVFSNGKGSYDMIVPRVKALIQGHRTRPIVARVTLTSDVTDVVAIYRHLKDELGFHEIGFAPVTTAPTRLYSIGEKGMHTVLSQFHKLADEYLEFALRGEQHGFTNVSDTIAELYQGVNKSHPCGAGLGLIGVGPSGDIAPCHRFVDSDTHALGHISTGIDKEKKDDFLNRGHVNTKYDCHSCWARPVCAGGCHHEAYVRYGDTGHPNLHYCDWIREWTDRCLQIFATISVENPQFLEKFAERKAL